MTARIPTKLGIIAGAGRLPVLLIESCRKEGRPFCLIALDGAADPAVLPVTPDISLRLGAAGRIFEFLNEAGVEDVVMAGKVRRPNLTDLMPDWRTAKFIARVGVRAFGGDEGPVWGDDSLLRAVIAEIEGEGFRVIGVEDVLADSVAAAGSIGCLEPTDADQTDISGGLEAAWALGRADRGQSVAILNGCVLAEEDEAGTDAMIARAGELRGGGGGPILVKAKKPQQDRRADLPAIGPDTVIACVNAGFRGIAIEADGVLVIDAAEIARIADANGLFVVAIDTEDARRV